MLSLSALVNIGFVQLLIISTHLFIRAAFLLAQSLFSSFSQFAAKMVFWSQLRQKAVRLACKYRVQHLTSTNSYRASSSAPKPFVYQDLLEQTEVATPWKKLTSKTISLIIFLSILSHNICFVKSHDIFLYRFYCF